jgi:hypothetical protein
VAHEHRRRDPHGDVERPGVGHLGVAAVVVEERVPEERQLDVGQDRLAVALDIDVHPQPRHEPPVTGVGDRDLQVHVGVRRGLAPEQDAVFEHVHALGVLVDERDQVVTGPRGGGAVLVGHGAERVPIRITLFPGDPKLLAGGLVALFHRRIGRFGGHACGLPAGRPG